MKLRFARALALGLGLLPALSFAGEEQIKTNSALDTYRRSYVNYLDHRAFAQSPDGAYGMSAYQQSRENAIADALRRCNARVSPGGAPCVVINVNGEWKR